MLGNIIEAAISIQGTKPLMWHRFREELIMNGRHERTATPGFNPNEWQTTVWVTTDSQLYIPGQYIYSCLCKAASYTRDRRVSYEAKMASTLTIREEQIIIAERVLPTDITFDPEQQFTWIEEV
jgi:hypothetical protein